MIKKLGIIGDWFGTTGYASHCKQLAKALNKHIEVAIACNKPNDWIRYVSDEEMRMMNRPIDETNVRLYIMLPYMAEPFLAECDNNILFAVWEGDKVPKSWIDIFLKDSVKQIWCPSQHVKDAICQTLRVNATTEQYMSNCQNKIKIVPHGVDQTIFYPKPELREKKFTFITNKGWRGANSIDRGGLQYTLKAFDEEFRNHPDVQLLVKINAAYNPNMNIQAEFSKLGITTNNIHVMYQDIPYEQLNDLYNRGHVYVSTSMAEAFNLGCIEAMACGLPVITTDFGGMTDFVNDINGYLLTEGTMFEVKHDLMYEGISWKRPNIQEIRRIMRLAYEERDNMIINSSCLQTAKAFSWSESAKKAFEFLKELK